MEKVEILNHELVPEHEIISEKEKEELLKKYGISLKQLPRILSSDPAISHLNCKPGDVIKIKRKSEVAGETIYYRVVIKG